MVAGEPKVPANPLFISDRARVYSEYEGIWHKNMLVQTGDYVTEGTELGSSQITWQRIADGGRAGVRNIVDPLRDAASECG